MDRTEPSGDPAVQESGGQRNSPQRLEREHSVDDTSSILNTYSRYAQAMADRRFDVYAEQFTVDGTLITKSGTFRGRAAIEQFNAEKYQGDSTTRVMWCNPVV